MKASDAKQFIGKWVEYQSKNWHRPQRAVIVRTEGRNIITETDALWAPDISSMKLVEDESCQE